MARPATKRKPRPMGRPQHNPSEKDRGIVKVMTAGGIMQAHIAAVLNIAEGTLRRHYRREIAVGAAELNGRVVAALYTAATGGDVKAQIWITQARLGWVETVHQKHSGEIGSRAIPDEQLNARLAKLLGKAGAAEPAGGKAEADEPSETDDILPGDGTTET